MYVYVLLYMYLIEYVYVVRFVVVLWFLKLYLKKIRWEWDKIRF